MQRTRACSYIRSGRDPVRSAAPRGQDAVAGGEGPRRGTWQFDRAIGRCLALPGLSGCRGLLACAVRVS